MTPRASVPRCALVPWRVARPCWLVAGSCAVVTLAHAGPPFLTDDPEPVELHHAEVNLIYQQVRSVGGRAGAFSGELNVGCARETQCHVALPVAFDRASGGPYRSGIGDAEFGLKRRFLHSDDSPWSAAIYPTVTLPTGDESRGLGNGRAQLLLPVWIQRTAGPWAFDAGLAWLGNPARGARNSWFAGLLAQRSFGERFSLGAEVFRRSPVAQGGPTSVGFNMGAVVSVASHQNLLLSVGRGLSGTRTNRGSVFVAWQLEH